MIRRSGTCRNSRAQCVHNCRYRRRCRQFRSLSMRWICLQCEHVSCVRGKADVCVNAPSGDLFGVAELDFSPVHVTSLIAAVPTDLFLVTKKVSAWLPVCLQRACVRVHVYPHASLHLSPVFLVLVVTPTLLAPIRVRVGFSKHCQRGSSHGVNGETARPG